MTIEEIVISYLADENIEGIGDHAYAEAPEDEEVYVLVERSGGSVANFIREHRIYTEVCVPRNEMIGQNKILALRLHEAVIEAMLRISDTTPVYRCHLNADYEAADPNRKQYRYQALWQITI